MREKLTLDSYIERIFIFLGSTPQTLKLELIDQVKKEFSQIKKENPHFDEEKIILKLNDPELIALQFLNNNNLLEHKPKPPHFIKWIFAFFFAMVGFFSVLTLSLYFIFQTHSFIEWGKDDNRIHFFADLFDVDVNSQWEYHQDNNSPDTTHIIAQKKISLQNTNELKILFTNGDLDIRTHKQESLNWDCEVSKETRDQGAPSIFNHIEHNVTLDFSKFLAVKCLINIPERLYLIVKGTNGKVSISSHLAPLDIRITHASIRYSPHAHGVFNYSFKIDEEGQIDTFDSNDSQNALPVRIHLNRGSIKK